MITKKNARLCIQIPLFSLLCVCTKLAAESMTIEDKKGRSMVVTLLERQGDKVSVERVKDGKKFLIAPDQLSEKSGKLLKEKAKALKEAIPPLEIEVVPTTRRKNSGYSTKMMTITAKVTVTNKDSKVPCPTCYGNIIFLGRDQHTKKRYMVLSNQKFQMTPTTDGTVFTSKQFVNSYYDDDYGYSSYGNYKYTGYLVVLRDSKGKVIETKTTSSAIKKAMETNITTARRLVGYPRETRLDEDLKKNQVEVE